MKTHTSLATPPKQPERSAKKRSPGREKVSKELCFSGFLQGGALFLRVLAGAGDPSHDGK